MKNEHLFGILVAGIVGLVVIDQISKSRACGPTCQVILSDARGTLIRDVVSGFVKWV